MNEEQRSLTPDVATVAERHQKFEFLSSNVNLIKKSSMFSDETFSSQVFQQNVINECFQTANFELRSSFPKQIL